MTLERTPLNLAASRTQRGRLAGVNQPGGYQIYNRDLNGTIWISTSQSVSDGQGTPIAPGTTVTITTDLDIYYILGSDTQSLTVNVALFVVTYDASDLQPSPVAIALAILNSGVLVIDQPTILLPSTALGVSTFTYDISRYNSIYFDVTFNPNATFTYQFTDSTGTVDYRTINVINGGFGGGNFWQAWVPAKGSHLKVSGNGITLTVAASYRQTQAEFNQKVLGANNAITSINTTIAGAPASATMLIPPWFGEVAIRARTFAAAPVGAGAVNCAVDLIDDPTGITQATIPLVNPTLPGQGTIESYNFNGVFQTLFARLSCWGTVQRVVFNNQTAGNLTIVGLVRPLREGP